MEEFMKSMTHRFDFFGDWNAVLYCVCAAKSGGAKIHRQQHRIRPSWANPKSGRKHHFVPDERRLANTSTSGSSGTIGSIGGMASRIETGIPFESSWGGVALLGCVRFRA